MTAYGQDSGNLYILHSICLGHFSHVYDLSILNF